MGKKQKKESIIINDNELEVTTLGILEENKKSSVMLFIFFAIFIIFALFLPNITGFINSLFEEKEAEPVIVSPDDKDEEKDDEKEIIETYEYSNELVVNVDKLTISAFNKLETSGNYYISFSVLNNSENLIKIGEVKYFIELYNNDNTLLGRHIFNTINISSKASSTQLLSVSEEEYNSFTKLIILSKTEKDYSDYTLKENEDKEFILSCFKKENTIKYYYDKTNKLITINDSFNFTNDFSPIYANNLNTFKTTTVNYNNLNGVTSSLVEVSSGFTVSTLIDVETANISQLSNANYYSSNNLPKVVKFEMEARGYSCS